jgi:hypothetical protein
LSNYTERPECLPRRGLVQIPFAPRTGSWRDGLFLPGIMLLIGESIPRLSTSRRCESIAQIDHRFGDGCARSFQMDRSMVRTSSHVLRRFAFKREADTSRARIIRFYGINFMKS